MQIDIKSFLNGSIGVGGGWCVYVSVIPVCPIIQIMSLQKEAFREDYPAKESRTKDLQPFFCCIITKV